MLCQPGPWCWASAGGSLASAPSAGDQHGTGPAPIIDRGVLRLCAASSPQVGTGRSKMGRLGYRGKGGNLTITA